MASADMEVPYNIEDAIASYGDDPSALKSALRNALTTLKDKTDLTENLNLNYGDEVLQNIQLDHQKRKSEQMADEWKQEAEKLKAQLEAVQRADMDDEDDDDPNRLKQKVEQLNFEYGDEILQNAKLQKEKRESLALAQKWQEEAEELRRLLDEERENNTQGTDTMDEDERIRQMEEAMDEMESRLSAEQARASDLRAERRASIQAMHAYQKEAAELRKLVTDETAHLVPQAEKEIDLSTLDPYRTPQGKPDEQGEDLWKKVEELGFELGDEILKNTKLNHEKRESLLLAEKYKGENEELKRMLESNAYEEVDPDEQNAGNLQELRDMIRQLKDENASLKETNNSLSSQLQEKQKAIEQLGPENEQLRKENEWARESKEQLLKEMNTALDQSRDYIRFLGALTKKQTADAPAAK